MKLTAVKSSNVHSIGYDEPTTTLRVKYRNGAIYDFRNVTPLQHLDLMKAKSKGGHMAQITKKCGIGKRIN